MLVTRSALLNSCCRYQSSLLQLSLGLFSSILTGCSFTASSPPVEMVIHQQWQLQPGDRIAGHAISSGLGDIVVELSGSKLYAPMAGRVQWLRSSNYATDCALFSSPEIPAYRLRLCGLKQVNLGDRQKGQSIGSGTRVALAMLRKQADGTWAMVEPATAMLEQFLAQTN